MTSNFLNVQFASRLRNLFVKHKAFYIGNVIDVGVEILAMKSLQKEMASDVGYYEAELYNLIREGRGVPAVPFGFDRRDALTGSRASQIYNSPI